jgi:hypothetical protein
MNKKKILKASFKPVVKTVSPSFGKIDENGGDIVKITGENFDTKYKPYVRFGSKGAIIQSITPKSITVQSPWSAGTLPVTVSSTKGVSSKQNAFTYINPTLTSLSPGEGPSYGGNTVVITGTSFDAKYGPAVVKFGSAIAIITNRTPTTLTVTAPPGARNNFVQISITIAGTTTTGLSYQYLPIPFITSISPQSGSKTGGTPVTITGLNLDNVELAQIGTYSITVGSNTQTQIVGTTIACSAGDVGIPLDLKVITFNSGIPAILNNAYTYTSP